MIEQSEAIEVVQHLGQAHGKLLAGPMEVPDVLGGAAQIGGWQTAERVRDPDPPLFVAMRSEQSTHEDADTAPPDPCLQQIAGDRVREHLLDAEPDVPEPFEPDHGERFSRPVAALRPHFRVVRHVAYEGNVSAEAWSQRQPLGVLRRIFGRNESDAACLIERPGQASFQ